MIDTFGERSLIACDCTEGQRIAQRHLLRGSDATPEMLSVTLDTLVAHAHQADARKAGVALTIAGYGWLTLAGEYGVGKSTLLWACLNELREAGLVGQYFTASRMLDWLRAGIGVQDGTGQSERDRVTRLGTLPVLVLDELDKAGTTEYAQRRIFDVLNERYRRWDQGATLLAFNDASAVHNALHSRIRDGRFKYIEMTGPDIRPMVKQIRDGAAGLYGDTEGAR